MKKSVEELYKLACMLFEANIPFQIYPDTRYTSYTTLFYPDFWARGDENDMTINSCLVDENSELIENNELLEIERARKPAERNLTAEEIFERIKADYQRRKETGEL